MNKTKLIKYRFFIFLKQFKLDEIKVLMNFLELVVNEYKNNSFKLFDLLDFENESFEDELDLSQDGGPKILKVESLNATNTSQVLPYAKPILRQPSAFLKSQQAADKQSDDQQGDVANEDGLDEIGGSELNVKNETMSDTEDNTSQTASIGHSQRVKSSSGLKRQKPKDVKAEVYDYEMGDEDGNEEEDDDIDYDDKNTETRYWRSTYDSQNRVRKFSDYIRTELEKHFQVNKYLIGETKKELAVKLNLEPRQVQKWFVHRREKFRREQRAAAASSQHQLQDTTADYDGDQSQMNETQVTATQQKKTVINPAQRFKFSPKVLNFLEKIFSKSSQLTNEQYEKLGLRVNVTTDRLKSWFKYRRQLED